MKNDEISIAAAAMGRKGGKAKNEKKTASCRANGKLGALKRWEGHTASYLRCLKPSCAIYEQWPVKGQCYPDFDAPEWIDWIERKRAGERVEDRPSEYCPFWIGEKI